MSMSPDTLSTELQKIDNASTEPPVTQGWFDAIKVFWEEAQADPGAIAPTPDASDTALTAMKGAMTGISTPRASGLLAAQQIFSPAFAAFWSTMSGIIATVFSGAVTLTPPPWTIDSGVKLGFETALGAVFDANKASALPKADSYDAIAAAIAPFFAGASYVDSVPSTYTIS